MKKFAKVTTIFKKTLIHITLFMGVGIITTFYTKSFLILNLIK